MAAKHEITATIDKALADIATLLTRPVAILYPDALVLADLPTTDHTAWISRQLAATPIGTTTDIHTTTVMHGGTPTDFWYDRQNAYPDHCAYNPYAALILRALGYDIPDIKSRALITQDIPEGTITHLNDMTLALLITEAAVADYAIVFHTPADNID